LDHPPPPQPSLAPKREWEDQPAAFIKLSPKHDMSFQQLTPPPLSLQTVRWRGIQKTVGVGYRVDEQCGVAGALRYVNFMFSFFFLLIHHTKYTPNKREDLRHPPAPAPAMPVSPQNKWEGTPSLAQPLPSQPPLPSKQVPGQHC